MQRARMIRSGSVYNGKGVWGVGSDVHGHLEGHGLKWKKGTSHIYHRDLKLGGMVVLTLSTNSPMVDPNGLTGALQ